MTSDFAKGLEERLRKQLHEELLPVLDRAGFKAVLFGDWKTLSEAELEIEKVSGSLDSELQVVLRPRLYPASYEWKPGTMPGGIYVFANNYGVFVRKKGDGSSLVITEPPVREVVLRYESGFGQEVEGEGLEKPPRKEQ